MMKMPRWIASTAAASALVGGIALAYAQTTPSEPTRPQEATPAAPSSDSATQPSPGSMAPTQGGSTAPSGSGSTTPSGSGSTAPSGGMATESEPADTLAPKPDRN